MRLLIFALLLSGFAHAGELDGKALTCDTDWTEDPLWFVFDDGIAYRCTIQVSGTTAVDSCFKQGAYSTSVSVVVWEEPLGSHSLNRESLKLVITSKNSLPSSAMVTVDKVIGDAQCIVPESLEAWRDNIKAAVRRKQQAIDGQTKNNKI